jgi:hypothetical protein
MTRQEAHLLAIQAHSVSRQCLRGCDLVCAAMRIDRVPVAVLIRTAKSLRLYYIDHRVQVTGEEQREVESAVHGAKRDEDQVSQIGWPPVRLGVQREEVVRGQLLHAERRGVALMETAVNQDPSLRVRDPARGRSHLLEKTTYNAGCGEKRSKDGTRRIRITLERARGTPWGEQLCAPAARDDGLRCAPTWPRANMNRDTSLRPRTGVSRALNRGDQIAAGFCQRSSLAHEDGRHPKRDRVEAVAADAYRPEAPRQNHTERHEQPLRSRAVGEVRIDGDIDLG